MQGVMNGLEHQAPFVLAAGDIAIAARRARFAPPRQHVRKRLPEQRLFGFDGGHQRCRISLILAHRRVSRVSGDRRTVLLANLISAAQRSQDYVVLKRKRVEAMRLCYIDRIID